MKIISVNIELVKHVNKVRELLEKEKPDVVCLQEVLKETLQDFAKEFGMEFVFGQMSNIGQKEELEPPFVPYGVGILSKLPIEQNKTLYYTGSKEEATARQYAGNSKDDSHPVVVAMVDGFTIGTTHFTWSAGGEASDMQRKDVKALLEALKPLSELVFVGDFNAPRGKEIFDIIASKYKDNIPAEYTTSIDGNLHRDREKLRDVSLMVDGLFTTPEYKVSNIRLQDGVSDHMAIVAEVQKVI